MGRPIGSKKRKIALSGQLSDKVCSACGQILHAQAWNTKSDLLICENIHCPQYHCKQGMQSANRDIKTLDEINKDRRGEYGTFGLS